MNKVQEYLIKKKAKEKAEEFSEEDSYVQGLVVNEARVKQAGCTYEKFVKMREMISLPSVQNRKVKDTDAIKTLLITGTIGAAGAIAASAIAGCNLGDASIITMAGSLSGMALGCVGVEAYKANIGSRVATAIQRNKLKKEMTKAERDEKKAELYVSTLESEFEAL